MSGEASVSAPMAHSLRNLTRAIATGLALSLLCSTALMMVLAYTTAKRPCEYPDSEECQFELETNAEIARLQSYAAIGSALIGTGLLIALRRKDPQ